ncbi:MAG: tetratricopeptide repeat protein, partial [Ignavibacteriaceae bacterium]
MLTKKKKLSKKEIKEDKLVVSYYKARGYFEENKNRVLLYVGSLLVLIAVVFFYIQNKKQNNQEASAQLSRVMDLYDKGSYLEAIEGRAGTNIKGLKYIVNEYGSTENGETAKIYMANSYFMLGKTDEAFKYYKDYGGDNDIFKASALAGQAGYQASQNKFEEAADLYKKASRISEEDVLNPEYMLKAGINYIKAGKEEVAKELLEKIKKDYTTSSAFREVDKYLA